MNLGESNQAKIDMQTTLSEWFELCACPRMVTPNILECSFLNNFSGKANASQPCDTSLMVALPAELRQTSLHSYAEIKISSFSSFL